MLLAQLRPDEEPHSAVAGGLRMCGLWRPTLSTRPTLAHACPGCLSRCSLACPVLRISRLCLAQDVGAENGLRDALVLHLGGVLESAVYDGPQQLGFQEEVAEARRMDGRVALKASGVNPTKGLTQLALGRKSVPTGQIQEAKQTDKVPSGIGLTELGDSDENQSHRHHFTRRGRHHFTQRGRLTKAPSQGIGLKEL